jgi:hypothetical protein
MSIARRIWLRLGERGASNVCHVCGGTTWEPLGELENLHVLLPVATEHMDVVAAQNQMAGLPAYPFVCANCGFIRLHSAQTLGRDDG